MRCLWLGSVIIYLFLAVVQVSVADYKPPVECSVCNGYDICGFKGSNLPHCLNGHPCTRDQYRLCVKMLSRDPNGRCDRPGTFPDPGNSTSFYKCVIKEKTSRMVKFPLTCPSNTSFDATTLRCLTKEERTVLKAAEELDLRTRSPKETFQCERYGVFSNPHDCKKYHVCDSKLQSREFYCPVGTYFGNVTCRATKTHQCIKQLITQSEKEIKEAQIRYRHLRHTMDRNLRRMNSRRKLSPALQDRVVKKSFPGLAGMKHIIYAVPEQYSPENMADAREAATNVEKVIEKIITKFAAIKNGIIDSLKLQAAIQKETLNILGDIHQMKLTLKPKFCDTDNLPDYLWPRYQISSSSITIIAISASECTNCYGKTDSTKTTDITDATTIQSNEEPLLTTTSTDTTPFEKISTTTLLTQSTEEPLSTMTSTDTTPFEKISTTTLSTQSTEEPLSTTTSTDTTPFEEISTTTLSTQSTEEPLSTTTSTDTTPFEEISTTTLSTQSTEEPLSTTTSTDTTPFEEISTTTLSTQSTEEPLSTTTSTDTTPFEEISTTTLSTQSTEEPLLTTTYTDTTTEQTPTSQVTTETTEEPSSLTIPTETTTEGTPTSQATTETTEEPSSSTTQTETTTEGKPTSPVTTKSTEKPSSSTIQTDATTEGTPTSPVTTKSTQPSSSTTQTETAEETPTSQPTTETTEEPSSLTTPTETTTEGTPTSQATTETTEEPSSSTTQTETTTEGKPTSPVTTKSTEKPSSSTIQTDSTTEGTPTSPVTTKSTEKPSSSAIQTDATTEGTPTSPVTTKSTQPSSSTTQTETTEETPTSQATTETTEEPSSSTTQTETTTEGKPTSPVPTEFTESSSSTTQLETTTKLLFTTHSSNATSIAVSTTPGDEKFANIVLGEPESDDEEPANIVLGEPHSVEGSSITNQAKVSLATSKTIKSTKMTVTPFMTTSESPSSTTKKPKPFRCPYVGYFRDPTDCHSFYRCRRVAVSVRNCPNCASGKWKLVSSHHTCKDGLWFSNFFWKCVKARPLAC